MKANVGGIDRTVRIVAGLVLLSLTFILPGDARFLGLIGIVPLATALIRWCPIYPVFGLSTCPVGAGK
jgi:Protein of unknown function (DUF2892)